MKRIAITFGDAVATLAYRGEPAARIVDFLYRTLPTVAWRDLPAPEAADESITTQDCLLTTDPSSGMLALYSAGMRLHESPRCGQMAEHLQGEVCRRLAEQSRGGLLFHAAGLSRQQHGLVMPAASGSGKTTLTAWLLGHGWSYLSDEMVFVTAGANVYQSFARPLNLKRESVTLMARPFVGSEDDGSLMAHASGVLASPAAFGAVEVLPSAPLDLFIFPCYTRHATLSLTPLSPAQAGLALMQCLVNARNLPEHGFLEIARLARFAPAFSLSYSDLDQAGACIERTLACQKERI